MREKRDWSSERVLDPVLVVGEETFWLLSLFHGLATLVSVFLPMPRLGTVLPSLFVAEVCSPPLVVEGGGAGCVTASYEGGGGDVGDETPVEA